jgi:hypothetical protein
MNDVATEDLKFVSGPGLKISAKIYRPSSEADHKTGVVMCHGHRGMRPVPHLDSVQ